jgi:hypothetical protein
MLYQRKPLTIEARVYDGPKLTVISDEKGQQTAKSGDYLVGSERGKVTVVLKADFEKDFEMVGASLAIDPKPSHFDTLGEAEDYVKANLQPGDTIEFTVGDDPTVQTAK